MRIDPRVRTQVSSNLPPPEVAPDPRALEAQAQAVQALQRQSPALQAFKGESGFDGVGGVSSAQRSPALQAFQGVSGFDGPNAVQGPKEEQATQKGPPERGPGFQAPQLSAWMKVLTEAIGNVAG